MERAETPAHGAISTAAEIVEAGIVTGVTAGCAMAAWLTVYAGFTGLGAFTPVKLIAGTFYGAAALEAGWGPVFWGFTIHMAISVAFAILYGAIVHRDTEPFKAVTGGILFGFAMWVVLTFLVMPVVDPLMRARVPSMSMGWFGAHLPYGAVLGALPQVRRWFAGA